MRTSIVRAVRTALAVAASCAGGVAAQEADPPAPIAGTAPTIDEALERAAFRSWRARRDALELADGSTLTSYAGETRALGWDEAALRVAFVPRFGCAPGIEIVAEPALAARLAPIDGGAAGGAEDRGAGLTDDDEARFAIDGTPVGFPVLRDEGDGAVTLAFNGNERERVTLRLQLDVGDVASLGLSDDESLTFSLLGSRSTLAAVESLCLTHEPADPDGAADDDG